jgi:hypothetical protein
LATIDLNQRSGGKNKNKHKLKPKILDSGLIFILQRASTAIYTLYERFFTRPLHPINTSTKALDNEYSQ